MQIRINEEGIVNSIENENICRYFPTHVQVRFPLHISLKRGKNEGKSDMGKQLWVLIWSTLGE